MHNYKRNIQIRMVIMSISIYDMGDDPMGQLNVREDEFWSKLHLMGRGGCD